MEQGEPKLLKVAEVAKLLGVCRLTVYRAIERGDLRPVKLSPRGHMRIDREELEAYVFAEARGERT